MFKLHEIREIIKLLDQSSIKEFELEADGSKLSIKKSGGVEASQPVVVCTEPVAYTSAPAEQHAPKMEAAVAPQQAPAAPAVAAPSVENEANLHKIVSPMVGTFYISPEPGAPVYVNPGDRVTPNKVVCIVEAMKLFNEIEAEVTGEIVKVLVEDGQLVEYGQPLFLVKAQ
ncbi:acetyl-CoA carboxylase biotin carboxyl carrier protein [Brevibacillus laterosporus]|uniref:acetyl-CoA carboxylase biotin carboxyl carrier protein n=1 Tax=Brevibacillus TaxID=55080 RepID=UPI0002403E4D|nr:acetyl-CoA carboxylase biotin carboxyl carrier protein [Brevibacillus laterosporus]MBA4534651.1 acetyl-CoA carboxylase biotin carboxyl carrier protein [Brevibacillus halotolerans]MCR8964986.1 acetyl-CoA carboxylase biotin carboxyl carrier protein [Brevibacillus laterosporus]MCR8995092.1 acetyl-CoA carboxylase biotin carboxyl carrier protein [Brevibacillus laterosporus]MCZ0837141.1 acetyl-CoA carboxylase biotin carboxyl carrier protein [Brevibacillus halotolerans]MDF9411878.1 acetyl-CoA carb